MGPAFINVTFTVSDDPQSEAWADSVIALSDRVVLERYEPGVNLLVLPEALSEGASEVHIDRARCRMLELEFISMDSLQMIQNGVEWLRQASFLEVVEAFAEK